MDVKERMESLFRDVDFVCKLIACDTVPEAKALLESYEVYLTLEEVSNGFRFLQANVPSNGALSEEDLDQVVGGVALASYIEHFFS